ncbi:hypothetical protein DKX15_17875, partial [Enterococcus faecium]
IQDLLTEASRTWGDRLLGALSAAGPIAHGTAEHYAAAFPEEYKQAVSPVQALTDIAIIEELEDDSVKLVLADNEETDETGVSDLTWYL